MKIFKRIVLAVVVLAIVAIGALYWMGTREDRSTGPTQALADPAQRVAYGQYLARVGDCMTCHTARGGQPYAGGAAIPTPFGALYGPNITPDPETGIGKWSADDFWQALHNGKTPDGGLLYPAFPYTEYTKVTRADADALYAYLKSLPPVKQASRSHELEFPYNQRPLVALWRALYFKPGVDTPGVDTPAASQGGGQHDELWVRGRYLVEGLGHCVACHAPRNGLGATVAGAELPGGEIFGLGWYAPPLNSDAVNGLGRWSANEIVALLKTGMSTHGTASGPMIEVVTGGSQYLADGDAQAIAAFLKSLPSGPTAERGARPADDAAMPRGGKLYGQYCVQCHQTKGEGKGDGKNPAWPALAGNISVTAPSPQNAIRMVLEGGFAPATAANPQPHGMPPFGQILNDNDIAALVTYIRNSWGNAADDVTSLQVKRARQSSSAG
jgi:mono/diheme cytochrome c family protein